MYCRQLAIKHGLLEAEPVPHYECLPDPVLENVNFTLYWDKPVNSTDKTAGYNNPSNKNIHGNSSYTQNEKNKETDKKATLQ